MTIYTYSYGITASFPNQIYSESSLYSEIQNSSIAVALHSINADFTYVYFNFKNTLSSPETTTLNNIVATHSGAELAPNFVVDQGISGSIPWAISISQSSNIQQVTGSVGIANFPSTQTVSVSNPITTITSNQGSAGVSPWLVTGSIAANVVFPATQSISGIVSVSNFPATQTVSISNPTTVTQGASGSIPWNITGSVLAVPTGIQQVNGTVTVAPQTGSTFTVSVSNPVNSVNVGNFPSTQTVSVSNPTTVVQGASGSIPWNITGSVLALPTGIQQVNGTVTVAPQTGSVFTITGNVGSVVVFPTTQSVQIVSSIITQSISGIVSVSNFPATQTVSVSNPVTSISVSNPVNSVAVSNFPSTQTVSVSNPVNSVNVGNFPATQTVSVSNPVIVVQGTSGSIPWNVTGSVLALPTGIQQVNGTVTVAPQTGSTFTVSVSNPVNSVNVGNFPATQTVSVSNPVNSVAVSNFPSTQTVSVSNPVNIGNFPSIQQVNGTVTVAPQTGSVFTVTGNVGTTVAFPTTQSVQIVSSLITQSISGIVSVSNFPVTQTVSVSNPVTTISISNPVNSVVVSNFPSTQQVNGTVTVAPQTGSTFTVSVSNPVTSISVGNFPATQTVSVSNPVTSISVSNPVNSVAVSNFPSTQTVSVSNPVNSVNIGNFPSIQQVNGTVTVAPQTGSVFTVTGNVSTAVTFPTTQSVQIVSSLITQSISGIVSVSNFPATQTVSVSNPVTSIAVSNFPATQTVSVSNPTTVVQGASGSIPWNITGSVLALPTGIQQVNGTVAVAPQTGSTFTVSVSNPVNSVVVSNLPAVQQVNGTVTVAPQTGSVFTVTGNVSTTVTFPTTQSVQIVSSLITQSISGIVSVSNFPATQTVSVSNPVNSVAVSNFPSTQTVNGTVTVAPQTGSTFTVSVSNPVNSVNVGNFPVTQTVSVSNPITVVQGASGSIPWNITGSVLALPTGIQTVTGSISVSNFPTTQTVSVSNPVTLISVGNFPSTQTVSVSNPVTSIAVSNFPSVQQVNGTVTVAPQTGSIFTVTGNVGTTVTLPATQSVQIVSGSSAISQGNPLWITGSVQSLPTGVQVVTGSVVVANSIVVGVSNFPATQTVSVSNPTTVAQGISGSIPWKVDLVSSVSQQVFGAIDQAAASTPWKVQLYEGANPITSSRPIWITGSVFQNNFPVTQSVFVVGTVTQSIIGSVSVSNLPATQTVSVSNPTTVVQGASGSIPWKIENSLKETYSLLATSTAIGNGKSMVSILNSSVAGKIIKITSIKIINVQQTAVTGILAEFQIKRMTGHSVGTLLTPLTFDTLDTLDANVTARTGATITGEAASPLLRYFWSSDEWVIGTVDIESNDHMMQNLIAAYSPKQSEKPITLRSGEGLTIKQITNSTVGTFDIEVIFTEE